jgi:hypothetical protein
MLAQDHQVIKCMDARVDRLRVTGLDVHGTPRSETREVAQAWFCRAAAVCSAFAASFNHDIRSLWMTVLTTFWPALLHGIGTLKMNLRMFQKPWLKACPQSLPKSACVQRIS